MRWAQCYLLTTELESSLRGQLHEVHRVVERRSALRVRVGAEAIWVRHRVHAGLFEARLQCSVPLCAPEAPAPEVDRALLRRNELAAGVRLQQDDAGLVWAVAWPGSGPEDPASTIQRLGEAAGALRRELAEELSAAPAGPKPAAIEFEIGGPGGARLILLDDGADCVRWFTVAEADGTRGTGGDKFITTDETSKDGSPWLDLFDITGDEHLELGFGRVGSMELVPEAAWMEPGSAPTELYDPNGIPRALLLPPDAVPPYEVRTRSGFVVFRQGV